MAIDRTLGERGRQMLFETNQFVEGVIFPWAELKDELKYGLQHELVSQRHR